MSFWFGVAAVIAAAQGQAPTQAPGQVLTLDEAVNIALRNAFAIRTAESNVEETRQRVAEARGQLGPRVVLGATYTRFDEETTGSLGPGGGTIVFQPIDQKQATASLTLPIDIAGNLGRIVDAQRASLRAARENVEAAQNDTKLNVRRAYFNVLRAQRLVQVNEQNVADVAERLRVTRVEVEAGSRAPVDAIRIEAQLRQAEQDLILARNQLELAMEAFNNALGRPIETPVLLADVTGTPAVPVTPDEATQLAHVNRPELDSLSETLTALGYIRRAEERGLNPSLQVGVTHTRNIDTQGFNTRDASTVGTLSLNFPVFDSGVTRARVRAARQDEEQIRIQIEQTRLAISLEVRQALTNLSNARARLDAASAQARAASEALRLANVRYRAGEGILLEVIDAQTELVRARTSEVTAQYDYLTAYAELQRAVGADNLQRNEGETAPTTGEKKK